MNLIPIPQSTNVRAAGYDPATSTLVVEFRQNRRYSYADVPIALFHELTDGHPPHPWTRTGRRIKLMSQRESINYLGSSEAPRLVSEAGCFRCAA